MKINLARKKLLEGGIISGPSLYYPSPEIAEEAVQHGFDFVWIDWQHGAWSESSINASMAPFVNTDTIPLVRRRFTKSTAARRSLSTLTAQHIKQAV